MAREIFKPIHAEGYWSINDGQWWINYSDIMTALIQIAGSYVDSYASDLFIIWKYDVEKHFQDNEWKGTVLRMGFRDYGVDHSIEGSEFDEISKNVSEYGSYYYRRIVKLEIKIEGDKITMELVQEK